MKHFLAGELFVCYTPLRRNFVTAHNYVLPGGSMSAHEKSNTAKPLGLICFFQQKYGRYQAFVVFAVLA
jgi:hypothetical protein